MILSDGTLRARLHEFITEQADPSLINPASIDIRIGRKCLIETPRKGEWAELNLREDPTQPVWLRPGQFVLVETMERLRVPNGYAVEMKLKSSRAREGYNHSLAFWFDPGWDGIGTMEITNLSQHHWLPLYCGLRFAQIIIHELDQPAVSPYVGRYNQAMGVEPSKP